MNTVFYELFKVLIAAPLLTCLTEIPVVKKSGVSSDIRYIAAVNIFTNLFLNCGSVFINSYFGHNAYIIWVTVLEIIIIPVTEALLYIPVSERKFRFILLISYVSNALSFGAGMIISFLSKEIFICRF